MAKQLKYYLDEQKTQEIIVSWTGMWKNVTVTHNGHVVGGFPDYRALKEGGVFHLQDGSTLAVHFNNERYNAGLRVEHNGRPVKGSSGDPETRLKSVFGISMFIGALNFILGALAEFGHVEALRELGLNWTLMVIGVVIIALGFCTLKLRSAVALGFIIAIIASDLLLSLFFMLDEGEKPAFGGVFFRVFMIIALSKGFSAIRELKNEEAMKNNAAPINPFQQNKY